MVRSAEDEVDPDSRLLGVLRPQLDHAAWHGWHPRSWRVGPTALDRYAVTGRTEDVQRLMGLPVTRTLDLPRDEIRLECDRGPV